MKKDDILLEKRVVELQRVITEMEILGAWKMANILRDQLNELIGQLNKEAA